MEITSTPFIRNDYWGDYNDISQINNRIDNLESDMDLMNIHLTTDIENVSNNLNTYINSQADTTTTNNIVVNNINANYAEGNYANFDNTFTNNAYIENLTVNMPCFDITLNTPHMENITVTSGNIYSTNLFNVTVENISGTINSSTITDSTLVNATIDGNGVFGDVEINNAVINTANVDNLYINKSVEPVVSSAVLGYDITGKVIPVKATFDVAFPENASYLYTDEHGTAFAGTAETAVGESNNLVTSFAVANEFANMANTANEQYDAINNNFANIDNSFNDVNNTFANIDNSFNDTNNNFANIDNSFNDVNNTFDNYEENFIGIEQQFNTINNSFNTVNQDINAMQEAISYFLNDLVSPASQYNSASPVNYTQCFSIEYRTESNPTGSLISSGEKYGSVYIRTENNNLIYSSRLTPLLFDENRLYNENCSHIYNDCRINFTHELNMQKATEADYAFYRCSGLNVNVNLCNATNISYLMDCSSVLNGGSFRKNINVYSAVTADHAFSGQNIGIVPDMPNAENLYAAFAECNRLISGQNLYFPQAVNMNSTFFNCYWFNMPVEVDQVTDFVSCFQNCHTFNSPVSLGYAEEINADSMFSNCSWFNKPATVDPGSALIANSMFYNCTNFNQPLIEDWYDTLKLTRSAVAMFYNCANFNQPVNISANITNAQVMFYNCVNFNQPDIWISNLPVNIPVDNMFYNVNYIGNLHLSSNYNDVEKAALVIKFNNAKMTGYGIPNSNIFFDIE